MIDEPKEITQERGNRLLALVNRVGTPAMTPEMQEELGRLLAIDPDKIILALSEPRKQ
jgi:hypothetical protein